MGLKCGTVEIASFHLGGRKAAPLPGLGSSCQRSRSPQQQGLGVGKPSPWPGGTWGTLAAQLSHRHPSRRKRGQQHPRRRPAVKRRCKTPRLHLAPCLSLRGWLWGARGSEGPPRAGRGTRLLPGCGGGGTMLVYSRRMLGPPERGLPARWASPRCWAHNICSSAQLAPWRGCPGTAGSNYGPSVGKGKGDLKGRFMSCLYGGGRGG